MHGMSVLPFKLPRIWYKLLFSLARIHLDDISPQIDRQYRKIPGKDEEACVTIVEQWFGKRVSMTDPMWKNKYLIKISLSKYDLFKHKWTRW